MSSEVLPYRTDAGALGALLEACARGRASPARLRERGLRGKAVEGTLLAARELGFVLPGADELSERGRRFALADEAERRRLLRAALREYPPYGELLDAVQARGEPATDTEWIETWWATHDRGNSPSNRTEGAVAFGRLVDATGWGRFVAGRRGHATRIEWTTEGAGRRAGEAPPAPGRGEEVAAEPPPARRGAPVAPSETAAPAPDPEPAPTGETGGTAAGARTRAPEDGEGEEGRIRLVVRLPAGAVARLDLPARLPARERARLLAMIGSLIDADPPA